MIRFDDRRIDVSDPESWLKGADGRLILEDDDDVVAAAVPAIDRIPVRPFARPGRTLQMIGMKGWLRATGTTMSLILVSCLLAGFHLIPDEIPLYPMSAQLSVFGALMVASSRNARNLTHDVKGGRTTMRVIEAGGWMTVVTGPVLVALIATGVLTTS